MMDLRFLQGLAPPLHPAKAQGALPQLIRRKGRLLRRIAKVRVPLVPFSRVLDILVVVDVLLSLRRLARRALKPCKGDQNTAGGDGFPSYGAMFLYFQCSDGFTFSIKRFFFGSYSRLVSFSVGFK